MSADNWAICPRCLGEAHKANEAERTRVAALYGKVPIEEFDAARAAIVAVDVKGYYTFREDYEFYGAEDGEIQVRYSGNCSKCGLSAEIKDSKRFYP
jgi:hypothetical protein